MKNYRYRVGKYSQFGSCRGHWSKIWSTEVKIEHTNRREAEKIARQLNRRHGIDVANAEDVYAVEEI